MTTPEPREPRSPGAGQPATPPPMCQERLGDPRLAGLVERSLPRPRVPVEWLEPLVLVAQALQRAAVIKAGGLVACREVKHTELVRRVRGYSMKAATVRKMIGVLEREGLVQVRPPGYRRLGVTYVWLGDSQPIELPIGLATSRFERELLAALVRWPGGIKHATLLHRLSWMGLRARHLDAFVLRARRAGILRVEISPTGARWYQLLPGHGLKRVRESRTPTS